MLSVEKCNFSPRNFILSYRNLNYNKEKLKRNKDISWLPYCILDRIRKKATFRYVLIAIFV